MQAHGSITREMGEAGLQLPAVMLDGSRPVLMLLVSLGAPASSCRVSVLARSRH
jgi:hypothetical protein